MRRPNLRSFAAVLLVLVVTAGCGASGGGKDAGSGTDCTSAEVFCVGLVTDGSKIDDKSFNQSAWEGVQKVDADVVKFVETVDVKDYANNISQFTGRQFDVVVTVGFLMSEATAAAAKENPDTTFIGVDQNQEEGTANLVGLVFADDQAGYGAGYLAGLMTKSDQVGAVLGQQVPPVERFARGFEAGAKASNPGVKVYKVYHPEGPDAFNDPVWGAGEAKKQLAQGVDVVFGAGSKTGTGALSEVAKARAQGKRAFCIGVDTDQYETVPEARPCLLTSAMKLIVDGTADIIGQARTGTVKGGLVFGRTGLAPFHDLDADVPADVKANLAAIVEKMKAGTLKTGVVVQ